MFVALITEPVFIVYTYDIVMRMSNGLVSSLLVPPKVRDLKVRKTAASSFTYILTWEQPADPNGIIRYYKVLYHVGRKVVGDEGGEG